MRSVARPSAVALVGHPDPTLNTVHIAHEANTWMHVSIKRANSVMDVMAYRLADIPSLQHVVPA
jgi:hypothetical protein